MTALSFPTNPLQGDRYSAPNGVQYVYDGVKWIVEVIASSSQAITNTVQDRVAPMFVDGEHDGIEFTYNATTNSLSATVTGIGSTNQLVNGDYTVSLGSDGILSAGSITFGGTLKTGSQSQYQFEEITSGEGEDTVYYSKLTLPNIPEIFGGENLSLVTWGSDLAIKVRNPNDFLDDYTWSFANDGNLTLPGGATLSSDTVDGFTISQLGLDNETTISVNFGRSGQITVPISIQFNLLDTPTGFVGAQPDSLIIAANPNKDIEITPGDGANGHWNFGADGNLRYPGGITQSRQDDTFCSAGADTVVYTSTAQYQHAIKLFVMVEGMAPGGDGVNWDTQACDVIAVRGYANDIVHVTTYGVTYSSAAAFATFDGQWNATTNRIEITCRPVSPTNGVAVSVHAIEMTSND